MTFKRKRYVAQFFNRETDKVISVPLFSRDDPEDGTSGKGIASRKRDEYASKNGLTRLWSRVVPVWVFYKYAKGTGFYADKVDYIPEDEDTEDAE